jgi:hypothetical protein
MSWIGEDRDVMNIENKEAEVRRECDREKKTENCNQLVEKFAGAIQVASMVEWVTRRSAF